MAIQIVLPDNLPNLVKEKFKAAEEAQELTFWPTQVSILHLNGVPFQLRYSPSISQKPKSAKPQDGKKPIDPFLQPPEALLIADLGNHILVLNKFAIVPEHFILATKEFKEQTHLLEEEDVGVAHACLRAWRDQGKELFAFFNSGEHSGASQPHRHIQFLPVDSMMSGVTRGDWRPLVDKLALSPKLDLPFSYFATSLPPDPTSSQLQNLYISLHDHACRAVETYFSGRSEDEWQTFAGPMGSSTISYNLGLTDQSMVLIPRRAEGSMIPATDGEPPSIGPIALNGTVLAGTLLVKNETEWDALQHDPSQLSRLLERIGIPSPGLANDKLCAPDQARPATLANIHNTTLKPQDKRWN